MRISFRLRRASDTGSGSAGKISFLTYFLENIKWLAVILLIGLLMAVTMLLNGIPLWEIGYGFLLWGFVTGAILAVGYGRHRDRIGQLELMRENIGTAAENMRPSENVLEGLYQECIRAISREKNGLQSEMMSSRRELSEYYSMWVHQIKTPIAALKILVDEEMKDCLDGEDGDSTRIVREGQKAQELFRIEQYVDMALQYTRLDAEANDFVIQEVALDEVIKTSIRKYAKQFIHKKLRLTYEPEETGAVNVTAVTDKKWLGFVVDQLLSNAVKYTRQGGVTVSVLPEGRIVIEDTGIGIRGEDLPRVCEKGYTGYNGHGEKYSTGIGLYLCRKILERLGHEMKIASKLGTGTRVEIIPGQMGDLVRSPKCMTSNF